ncbi:hypothetical protein PFISCL1PPCAC_27614, partial [Pristionchus fissidentatus]
EMPGTPEYFGAIRKMKLESATSTISPSVRKRSAKRDVITEGDSDEKGISQLPVEIVKTILSYCTSSLRSARLVSRGWNALVVDNLARNIPPLEEISIHVDQFNMHLETTIPKKHNLNYSSLLAKTFHKKKFCELCSSENNTIMLEAYHFHHQPHHLKDMLATSGLIVKSVRVKGEFGRPEIRKICELLQIWKFTTLLIKSKLGGPTKYDRYDPEEVLARLV